MKMPLSTKKEQRTTISIKGELEIDQERGVIYFHSYEEGITKLRICNLPFPISEQAIKNGMNITHLFNASWHGEIKIKPKNN